MVPTTKTDEPVQSHRPRPTVQASAMLQKALVLLAIAVAGAMAYRFTALKEWLQPTGEAAAWVRETGLWGAAVFLVGMSGLILMGVPRLLFCPLAGALYGFWCGLGLSIAGTIVSYYAAFRVIRGRRTDSDSIPPLHPKLAF